MNLPSLQNPIFVGMPLLAFRRIPLFIQILFGFLLFACQPSASESDLDLPPVEMFGQVQNDTLLAGSYFEGKVWFHHLQPDDSLRVYCHEPLIQRGDTFYYRRLVNATSYDKNGFSRQYYYIHARLRRKDLDTAMEKEMHFWVRRPTK
jgi:hypothetical protein